MTLEMQIICALAAGMAGSLLWAISASYGARRARASHSQQPSTKTAPIVPAAQHIAQARASRKRVLRVEQVAELVARAHQFEDSEYQPILPGDLDDFIDAWCDENEVERVSTPIVRELIGVLAFVKRTRVRLNMRNPAHRYVRARQIARGEVNDRPTVYIVANAPAEEVDSPVNVRSEANVRPTPGRVVRSSVRPKDGQRPVARPEPAHAVGAAA